MMNYIFKVSTNSTYGSSEIGRTTMQIEMVDLKGLGNIYQGNYIKELQRKQDNRSLVKL